MATAITTAPPAEELDVRPKCKECGGDGGYYNSGACWRTCGACGGSGVDVYADPANWEVGAGQEWAGPVVEAVGR